MKQLVLLFTSVFISGSAVGQAQWNYAGELKFPESDTAFVQPYLCTVTSTGRLYVISSQVTRADAHNAIYYADTSDNVLTQMVDYHVTGDADTLLGDIGRLRGIGSVGTDIIVCASVPTLRNAIGVGTMYYYPDGDTSQVDRFGFYLGGAGYGTFMHGVTLTKDTIAFTGLSYNTSIRAYNYSYGVSTPARGSWIPLTTYPLEPGGPNSGGFDVIRDCAVIPEGDYDEPTTPWYSSRNSYSETQLTGGIAVWSGGQQLVPEQYSGQRIQDPFGLLSLGSSISYGITVDRDGYLWVAGNDSTRRWVKAFDVSAGIFASEVGELPSQNSTSNPDPAGAPMVNPADVALTPDGLTAYVPDAANRTVYVFKFGTVSVSDHLPVPGEFTLDQNFPNPFNPSTMMNFTLPTSSRVRLVVTNALGQEVATLADDLLEAGKHVRVFEGEKLPSGVYFYTLTAGASRLTKKMVLVR